MNSKIEITPEHLDIVMKILDKHLSDNEIDVYVFGSRAKSIAKRRSDLDLALKSKTFISNSIITAIKNDFDDSLLPYKVDIIDLDKISFEFKEMIRNDLIKLTEKC